MKFWALIWIIMGNTYLFSTYYVLTNTKDFDSFYKLFLFTLIPASFLAIDVFLFISATLNTYHMLKLPKEEFTLKHILKLYLAKLIRYIPLIAAILFVCWKLIGMMVSGPMANLYG